MTFYLYDADAGPRPARAPREHARPKSALVFESSSPADARSIDGTLVHAEAEHGNLAGADLRNRSRAGAASIASRVSTSRSAARTCTGAIVGVPVTNLAARAPGEAAMRARSLTRGTRAGA
jgi:hypothetical protein